ncbi:hypothetical protein KFK09_028108 [Dendrobium nobile]|uniref:J domain-containing protein n=1 Tax=Dendrobium nobile TaxID=94219 RepID=A0A8T3A2N7_DENNO|nr:hypothetical protein KFK09_028108 [Dendrobium nobile]
MQSSETPERDLYAILNISREASDEEIRKAFRQWAQVYHPDKYQDPEMKDVATANFQRIRDAYEILSDERKREIYDIYGLEGLNSGYELGEKLSKPEEIKEMLERLRRKREEDKILAHSRPSGALLANLSLPQYLDGGSIIRGMAMSSEVQSRLSKRNSLAIGGNLSVTGASGTGSASAMLKHQISSAASVEFVATAGLRALLSVQTSRQLSQHSLATSGIAISLRDGSINLTNAWTRQMSDTSIANIHLVLGTESGISIGWQTKDDKTSASGEVKFGTASLGASAHYIHHFSAKSHGRVSGRIGSTALEFEIGGGRIISEFSTVRLFYNIGIQVQEARKVAKKAQKILETVSNRKKNKQLENGGLVISKAVYGNLQEMERSGEHREDHNDEVASQVLDVTLPLNFLVNDSGKLKLHEGIKKSGLMGFCDPCPGIPKQLLVEYTYRGQNYQVVVGDSEELLIPQERT